MITLRINAIRYKDKSGKMYNSDAFVVDTPLPASETSGGSSARISEVTLFASEWQGDGNMYSQVVNIYGVTANSQVDLTPSAEQLAIFYEKDIAFVTENEGGVITVYVIGQKPQNDYTIQVTITEVQVNE